MGRAQPAQANLRACAAAAAATLALAGCGGDERRDAGVSDRTYTVDVERVSFPARQHLAQRTALEISVRNAGDETIPNLTAIVRGFAVPSGGPRQADLGADRWIVDSGPTGARTSFEDTWTVGRLRPGSRTTLRWDVTPVVAGEHELTYSIAPAVAGSARAELESGGQARGALAVRVTDEPPPARVDPDTGAVRRQE